MGLYTAYIRTLLHGAGTKYCHIGSPMGRLFLKYLTWIKVDLHREKKLLSGLLITDFTVDDNTAFLQSCCLLFSSYLTLCVGLFSNSCS